MADDQFSSVVNQESVEKMKSSKPSWSAPTEHEDGYDVTGQTDAAQRARNKTAAAQGKPAFHLREKGGPVTAGENYIVGEKGPERFVPSVDGHILPAKKNMKTKHAGHGYTHVHVEHHKDGSHTVHHRHEDGAHKDSRHAASNIDGVHDSIEDHEGMPNPGEAEADAGDHGVPAAAAQQAGLPVSMSPAGASEETRGGSVEGE